MSERMSQEEWWAHIYLWFEMEVDEYLESFPESDTPETRDSAEAVLNRLRLLTLAGGDHEPSRP